MTSADMNAYLAPCEWIDFLHPDVAALAARLAHGQSHATDIARHCFEYVRDQIAHSWDARRNPVTCKASDVLLHGTGYCYAKSHLLAALLRANGIPAALCYQKLVLDEDGAYCLHGLNAVFLPQAGWYRIDARGNKAGIDAGFCPPQEQLAFPLQHAGEADYPELFATPHPVIIRLLTSHATVQQVYQHLPSACEQPWQSYQDLKPSAQT